MVVSSPECSPTLSPTAVHSHPSAPGLQDEQCVTARSWAARGWQAALTPPSTERTVEMTMGATDQEFCHPPLLKAVEIKSLKTGIYVACWRRQHSFCKEKSCLADLLELGVHGDKGTERGSSRRSTVWFWKWFWQGSTPKITPGNRTCHRMGGKTLRKRGRTEQSQFQSPKVVLQRGWLLPWQGYLNPCRRSLSEISLRKWSQARAASRADPRKPGPWGNWNQESKEV